MKRSGPMTTECCLWTQASTQNVCVDQPVSASSLCDMHAESLSSTLLACKVHYSGLTSLQGK